MNLTREEKLNLMLKTLRKLRNKNLGKFVEQEKIFREFVSKEFSRSDSEKIIARFESWKTWDST